ncbi:MAG: PD-(D/E)XK nuclease family protein [Nostocales cyanobacterium]|nr:MAG: PD-(D/E)XK nuclease family protein [Nostocales cyanobacterium]TAF07635.1 MAG: PD-(D/E)XK nuclease family protein [Nostocales cyanobacterium]
MSSTSTDLFRLSQGHLNVLVTCPRKFQNSYLEQLNIPINPEQDKDRNLGSQFHLLMQQQEMNLPIDGFLKADEKLEKWVKDINILAPEIFKPDLDKQIFRESEHNRTVQIGDYLITVVYDLLIAEKETAQILDWKTYHHAPKKEDLGKNWQTKLYMYVLAKTSDYLPENISMTYWFVQSQKNLKKIEFNYDSKQHQKIEQELKVILNNLTQWWEKYQQNQPFPQEPAYSQACHYCQYSVLCDKLENSAKTLPKLANIEEIEI